MKHGCCGPGSRWRERRGVLVKARPADIGDAVIPAMNAKAVQVIVVPAHEQLDDPVRVRDRQAVRKLNPPPNGGMKVPQQELQPQQQRRAPFDHHPTLDHHAEPCSPEPGTINQTKNLNPASRMGIDASNAIALRNCRRIPRCASIASSGAN
jgi:hypothetical protein